MTDTTLTENVRRYAAGLNAALDTRLGNMIALAVAVGFLVAAVALGLVWTGTATASVSHRVRTARATHLIYLAEVREWRRHDQRARSFAIRCWYANVRGKGTRRTGEPTACTFRAYRHTNHTGRIAVLPLEVAVVPRERAGLGEDGAGWVTYSPARSLMLDAMPRSQ